MVIKSFFIKRQHLAFMFYKRPIEALRWPQAHAKYELFFSYHSDVILQILSLPLLPSHAPLIESILLGADLENIYNLDQ